MMRPPMHWGARYGYVPSPQVPAAFYPPYVGYPHVGARELSNTPLQEESSINWPEVIAGAVVGALAAVIARRFLG